MPRYIILTGHSGREWTTAREASRFAASEWGTIEADSAEDAVEVARAEGLNVGDWHEVDRMIHVVPPHEQD